ncbi:MAG: hypothetical protein KJ732_01505 [Candidatus Margulisbacteria bacterium]|nr:hypothetical protein [Candidatus Margulisiibacteriota bacterium]
MFKNKKVSILLGLAMIPFLGAGLMLFSGCNAVTSDDTTTTTTNGGTTTTGGTGTTTTTTVRTYDFTVSEIHDSGASGQYSSIAVDSNNKVHIVHSASTSLLYTTNVSGSWVTTTIVSVGIGDAAMAIDGSNGLHVAYYDTTNLYLKYAYKADGTSTWTNKETVDSSGSVGYANSIAVDSNGKAHIVYRDLTNSDVKYATNASGGWVTEVADASGSPSTTSIAIDQATNNVYIAYQIGANLYYRTGTAGSWSSAGTADSGVVFRSISLKLDSSNKAHISYYNSVDSELKHTTNATGAWVDEVVPGAGIGSDGGYTSLAIDSSNNLFISYHKDYTSSGLSTALKVAYYVGGSWSIKEVKSGSETANIGMYSSIALDTNGNMHISFEEGNGSDLWYAVEE